MLPDLETIKVFLQAIWAFAGVQLIAYGVLGNVALAVAVALRTGTFSFRVLGEFLTKQLLPYVICYVVFKLASPTDFEWVATVVLGLIGAMIGAAILEKLKLLGVPIPDQVMTLITIPKWNTPIEPSQSVQPK